MSAVPKRIEKETQKLAQEPRMFTQSYITLSTPTFSTWNRCNS